jgi:uncharacterized protein (DUF488 family)
MAGIVVHTVGHSTHEAPDFVRLVRSRGIDLIADVRRYPGSRRVPWTNPGEMRAVLGEAGMAWEHFEELGGRRSPLEGSPNRGWDSDQFQGYADHMAAAEFQAALDRLLALAGERRVAVMCAEADWRRCHRRLLSDALLVRGAEVLHIGPRGGTSAHELTPFAVIEEGALIYPPAQGELGV